MTLLNENQADCSNNKRTFDESFSTDSILGQTSWEKYLNLNLNFAPFDDLSPNDHIPSFDDIVGHLPFPETTTTVVGDNCTTDAGSVSGSDLSPVLSNYVPDQQQLTCNTEVPNSPFEPQTSPNQQQVCSPQHDHQPVKLYNHSISPATLPTNQPTPVLPVAPPATTGASPSPAPPSPAAASPTATTAPAESGQFALRVVGPMESLWYADRPFPRFNIAVVDPANPDQPISSISNWKLSLRVIDGHGNDASSKIYSQVLNHAYPVTNGVAPIAGLRFKAVSSKSGGHFKVIISAINNSHKAAQWVSGKIQVLSYRLYHAQKVPFKDLKASDNIGKMKGIGTLYAKRFASLGFRSVADLASLEVELLSSQEKTALLAALRKDRGAMTLPKLAEYVQQARDIMARCAPQQQRRARTVPVVQQPQQQVYQQQQAFVNQQQQAFVNQQQQAFVNQQQQAFVNHHQQQQQPPAKRLRLCNLPPANYKDVASQLTSRDLQEALKVPLHDHHHALPNFFSGFPTI